MDDHNHSDFGGGFGGCDNSFQHGGFESHHSNHGGIFDNHGVGGFGGCDSFQQTTHHGGGFDHHHHGHHHGGLDPVQQDINCGGSVQHHHHHHLHHHGGMDHTHHHIHHAGVQQYPQLQFGQQQFSHQSIAVVGRTYPSGTDQRFLFKRQMTVGVILLIVSLGLIAAGAATIGFVTVVGLPLFGFGGVLAIAGYILTASGCTSYNKMRSQPVTPATVVMQPPSTVYVPPSYIISPGNATNTSAPYHQGFSTPPPPYSSK